MSTTLRLLHGVRPTTLRPFYRAAPRHMRYCSTTLHGLRAIPAAELSRSAVSLSHTYGPPPSTATVVANPAAFEEMLARVFASDEESPNDIVRGLRDALRQRRGELAPLIAAKCRVDEFVDKRCAPLLCGATFMFLVVQFVVLFRWVFVVFDWNFVEPMTYFIGYTVVWASLLFHYRSAGRDEFTWEAMLAAVSQPLRDRLYQRNGIDMTKLTHIEKDVRELEELLSKY